MLRIAWLLRRKPGITHAEFREHYERSHSALGKQYLGHLMLGYRRKYNVRDEDAANSADPMVRAFAAKAWDYDCIAEWDLRDEAALGEVFAILSDPVIGPIFHDDEEHFLDRDSVRLVRYDIRDTGTA